MKPKIKRRFNCGIAKYCFQVWVERRGKWEWFTGLFKKEEEARQWYAKHGRWWEEKFGKTFKFTEVLFRLSPGRCEVYQFLFDLKKAADNKEISEGTGISIDVINHNLRVLYEMGLVKKVSEMPNRYKAQNKKLYNKLLLWG